MATHRILMTDKMQGNPGHRLVFATGRGLPVVQVLDLDDGWSVPVASSLDGHGAFDGAVARRGWVAVRVGYKVAAFKDNGLWDPVILPDVWQIFPATAPDL